jgi:hypothetical protein
MKPKSDTAKDQIEKTVRYLEDRIEMIKYGSFKRGGYSIGSSGIESSNKFILMFALNSWGLDGIQQMQIIF